MGMYHLRNPSVKMSMQIDFEAMGFKEPLTVPSPYSDAILPIVIGGDGIFLYRLFD